VARSSITLPGRTVGIGSKSLNVAQIAFSERLILDTGQRVA